MIIKFKKVTTKQLAALHEALGHEDNFFTDVCLGNSERPYCSRAAAVVLLHAKSYKRSGEESLPDLLVEPALYEVVLEARESYRGPVDKLVKARAEKLLRILRALDLFPNGDGIPA